MKNGTCWTDSEGNFIQAHGGMITRFGKKWYWYGENKDAPNLVINGELQLRVPFTGIGCYSSEDLHTWHNEGLMLSPVHDAEHPLDVDRIAERPKVLYCEKTGKYVMWFHADRKDYTLAEAGVAVADRPEGPFQFLQLVLPNRRDCRDMTLFQDPLTGKAYLVHSGDWNKTLYFSELTDDYLNVTGVCLPQMVNQEREAPAMLVHDSVYYCITSGCTGWDPNSALYATCSTLSGSLMKLMDSPCEGPNARNTFGGQSTWVFEADGQWYLMLDHWKPTDLRHSGYSILPICFDNGRMTIPWREEF